MSFITPDMTAKKILSKYLQKQVLKPRNYSPFTNPTIICLMDVKVYLWHSFEFLSQSLIFFFRGQRFRWKREKGQVKGEEKRSIHNVPDKWGQRGKKQKERLELIH